MKTLIAFCQKTGRRLRQFINRQISKLTRAGQFKFSVTLSLPFIAKVEDQLSNERQQSRQNLNRQTGRSQPFGRDLPPSSPDP